MDIAPHVWQLVGYGLISPDMAHRLTDPLEQAIRNVEVDLDTLVELAEDRAVKQWT